MMVLFISAVTVPSRSPPRNDWFPRHKVYGARIACWLHAMVLDPVWLTKTCDLDAYAGACIVITSIMMLVLVL